MAYTFMSAAKKAAREAALEKMRKRNLAKNRGGRPRVVVVSQPPDCPQSTPAEPPPPNATPEIPPTKRPPEPITPSFRGAISTFQRQPRPKQKRDNL